MKKLFLTVAAIFAIAILMTGCPKPAGGDDNIPESRHEVSGKFGTWSAPYEVGDIVFSDGSASPYTDTLTLTDAQKAAAIAVIYYKGTGLNSDDSNRIRTLGVGLKQIHTKWCKDNASAYSRTITPIICTHTGTSPNVSFSGDKNGSDNLKQIGDFLVSLNGPVNDTIVQNSPVAEEKYPGFYFAKNYKNTANNLAGTRFESGWYVPSIAELFEMNTCMTDSENGFDLDEALALCGGNDNRIRGKTFWSSSDHQYTETLAYYLEFGGTKSSPPVLPKINNYFEKKCDYYFCAIREF